jgi:hypothetical protein
MNISMKRDMQHLTKSETIKNMPQVCADETLAVEYRPCFAVLEGLVLISSTAPRKHGILFSVSCLKFILPSYNPYSNFGRFSKSL